MNLTNFCFYHTDVDHPNVSALLAYTSSLQFQTEKMSSAVRVVDLDPYWIHIISMGIMRMLDNTTAIVN